MDERNNNKFSFRAVLDVVRRDFIYYVVMLVLLLALFITVYVGADYQADCNEHYAIQLEKCGCFDKPIGYDVEMSIGNIFDNENKNKVDNPKG